MVQQNRTRAAAIAQGALVYAVWAVFVASQIALVFWAHQIVISMAIVFAAAANNPWLPRTADMWSMVVLGAAALVAIFSTEGVLRSAMRRRRIWQAAAVIALIEGIAALIFLSLETFF